VTAAIIVLASALLAAMGAIILLIRRLDIDHERMLARAWLDEGRARMEVESQRDAALADGAKMRAERDKAIAQIVRHNATQAQDKETDDAIDATADPLGLVLSEGFAGIAADFAGIAAKFASNDRGDAESGAVPHVAESEETDTGRHSNR
jgi:hypothetical protein